MKSFKLWKNFEEKFSVKVFLQYTVFIVIISLSFTAFFVRYQGNSLEDTLIKEGDLLADIFAHNVRLGIFTEEDEFLKDHVEGVFRKAEVLSISVFDYEARPLMRRWKDPGKSAETPSEKEAMALEENIGRLKEAGAPFHLETENTFEFWAPVIAQVDYEEEPLLLGGGLDKENERPIGFITIAIGKDSLKESCAVLLSRSIGMAVLFLLLGLVVAYAMADRVTRPLNRLTEGVKALGMGGSVHDVPVDTKDEIGKLATAFNIMTASLKKRESEKRNLEKQLRHAQKMEAVGTLSGGIAHDFGNFLQSITYNIKLLDTHIDNKTRIRLHMDQISVAVMKAANLTKSLLSFSSEQITEPQPLNINTLIKKLKKLMEALTGEMVKIEIQPAKGALRVMADYTQIEQVLMNLTANARDAMPGGGSITITTESSLSPRKEGNANRYALISFKDTGTGMAKQTVDKMFDPFFTTKGAGKGTGLGLSMVYGIVQRHKGFIDHRTEEGKGTVFRIFIPLTKERNKRKTKKSPLPPRPRPIRSTERLLVAEDDKMNRVLLKDILEAEGYMVTEAKDGKEAIKKFKENKESISLLLFDVKMPKKSGKEAYKEIKKIKPDIRVVFITAYAEHIIHKKKDREARMSFLSKPITPDSLLIKIRAALED